MNPVVGTVLTQPGASAAELFAEPFDVVWIDLEHGALGRREAQEMVLGAQAAGTVALVRLPADEHRLLAAMLDAGADGVVIASVESAGIAAAAIAAARHPPAGGRGYGPRRLALRGRASRGASAAPIIWAQIETRGGVANAASIAAVDGIDALVVGTADLSFALDVPLRPDAEPMINAVARVRSAAASADCAFGLAGALIGAPAALLAGAEILVHSTDARLSAAAVDDAAASLHSLFIPNDREPVIP